MLVAVMYALVNKHAGDGKKMGMRKEEGPMESGARTATRKIQRMRRAGLRPSLSVANCRN